MKRSVTCTVIRHETLSKEENIHVESPNQAGERQCDKVQGAMAVDRATRGGVTAAAGGRSLATRSVTSRAGVPPEDLALPADLLTISHSSLKTKSLLPAPARAYPPSPKAQAEKPLWSPSGSFYPSKTKTIK